MTQPVSLNVRLSEAAVSTTSGLLEVEFITPGWGSSGYYSREVVEAAAPLFAKGTHMYFDHPSATERQDRPERSVRDLAAVVESDGTVDPTTGGIRGTVRPLAPYRDLLTDEAFATNVGLSISGSATDIAEGSAEGRNGPIIEGLATIDSVDFVTRAGRGGRVMAVLESAGVLSEATASDRRDQVSTALRELEDGWVWVRDLDADSRVVYYQVGDDDFLWQRSFEVGANDVDITFTGDPIRVSAVTTYVPITRSGSTTTEESEGGTNMAQISIEEAEHRRLTEAADRVATLESERDTALAERDTARGEAARLARESAAASIINEAETEFSALERRGLMADLPLNEAGELDAEAFRTTVNEAATEQPTATAGIIGNGTVNDAPSSVTENEPRVNAWGRKLQEV